MGILLFLRLLGDVCCNCLIDVLHPSPKYRTNSTVLALIVEPRGSVVATRNTKTNAMLSVRWWEADVVTFGQSKLSSSTIYSLLAVPSCLMDRPRSGSNPLSK